MLQCATAGAPGDSGHTSRTRSHRLITWSNRRRRTRRTCFERWSRMSMPRSRSTRTRVGVHGLGVAAGADDVDGVPSPAVPATPPPSGNAAVARAQEQHTEPGAVDPGRSRRAPDHVRARAGGPGGARPPASVITRATRPGRGCSTRRACRRSSRRMVTSPPSREPAEVVRRQALSLARPGPSAHGPGGRCGQAHSAPATGRGARSGAGSRARRPVCSRVERELTASTVRRWHPDRSICIDRSRCVRVRRCAPAPGRCRCGRRRQTPSRRRGARRARRRTA